VAGVKAVAGSKGGENGRGNGDGERRGADDTPRETPAAKVSEGRIPAAKPVEHPPAVARNGGSTPVPARAADETVRVDLPSVRRDAVTASDTRATRSEPTRDAAEAEIQAELNALVPRDDLWSTRSERRVGAGQADVGRVYVRTFRVTGVLGVVLLVLGLLVVLALFVAVFTFAVGVGVAVALAGTAAALLGVGAVRVRKAFRARGEQAIERGERRESDDGRGPGDR
jgi:hypothetical protein